jgi:DNA mismatch repair protein MutL
MASVTSRIHILSPSVARKIAAGEVIDRPAAVVRELMENSLDAGATSVDVLMEAGGNDLIRVTDNGGGMTREDLELCYRAHATSKIATDDDLMHVDTLGFRGEALGSMAAVSRLTVVSAPPDGVPHRLRVQAGRLQEIAPAAGSPGTTVEVADLFYNLPARRRFLKRPQSESALVRSVFTDRALAFPDASFRLFSGAEMRLFLQPGDRVARIAAAYPEKTEPSLLHALAGSGDGFAFELIAGEPSAARRDRKQLQVFVNRRRVWEYALVQAVEYAYRDYLHGGLYPTGYLFLDVQPELIDFNIHPAKREVRFRNLPDIHRRIVDVLQGYLRTFDRRAAIGGGWEAELTGLAERPATGALARETPGGAGDAGSLALRTEPGGTGSAVAYDLTRTFEIPQEPHGFRYLGQLFGLFLVVERENRLFLVDQHAAHERIIYEQLRNGPAAQELLFPLAFDVDSGEDEVLAAHRDELAHMGIGIEQREPGTWELTSTPASVEVDAESLVELIRELADRPADFQRELFASISCRAAVMDGDILSRSAALGIVTSAMEMTNARCPHGRPIWAEFSREELMRLVERM